MELQHLVEQLAQRFLILQALQQMQVDQLQLMVDQLEQQVRKLMEITLL
mgnify:CR=1 FL=1